MGLKVTVTVIEEIFSAEIKFIHGEQKGLKFSPGREFEVLSEIGDEVLVATSDNPQENARIPIHKVRFPEL